MAQIYGDDETAQQSNNDCPQDNDLVYDKFVLFGDSITERASDSDAGFALSAAITKDYIRKLQTVNRGFSGYTSRAGRGLIGKVLDADTRDGSNIQIMMVFFGSNDAAKNRDQYVPIEHYIDNMEYIVDQAMNKGVRVVVVGPALVNETRWSDRTNDRFGEYNRACAAIAQKRGVGFVDLQTKFLEALGYDQCANDPLPGSPGASIPLTELSPDGLHFSGAGYRVFYHALMEEINRVYPEMVPGRLEYRVPRIEPTPNDPNRY